ncbi:hypothetical protein GQ43DRAFT_434916 [Delitschia confertaspora ATCC 74209]|uniref:Uncharacterized protein n=1 Tax=Delitschia confertaspora ATCC 74209 TaxID=1513339 RepID=A0A9P4JJ94_9PLEO|nr:hypothetical protein GQ43DRAFT_434916 [Delitschia confertaspora ATCC 74209]
MNCGGSVIRVVWPLFIPQQRAVHVAPWLRVLSAVSKEDPNDLDSGLRRQYCATADNLLGHGMIHSSGKKIFEKKHADAGNSVLAAAKGGGNSPQEKLEERGCQTRDTFAGWFRVSPLEILSTTIHHPSKAQHYAPPRRLLLAFRHAFHPAGFLAPSHRPFDPHVSLGDWPFNRDTILRTESDVTRRFTPNAKRSEERLVQVTADGAAVEFVRHPICKMSLSWK